MDLREIGQEYAGRNHLARERAVDGSCVRDTEIPGCIKRGVFDQIKKNYWLEKDNAECSKVDAM